MTSSNPQTIYDERLCEALARLAIWEKRDASIADLRLVVFFLGAALALSLQFFSGTSPWPMLVPALIFLALIMWHEKVAKAKAEVCRCIDFYHRGLARIHYDRHFENHKEIPQEFKEHPYAFDLDIFGPLSLFAYLDTTCTRFGSQELASILIEHPHLENIGARQNAVRELTPNIDLREKIFIHCHTLQQNLEPRILYAWAEGKPGFSPRQSRRFLRVIAWGLTLAALTSASGWALGWWGALPLLVVALVQWGVGRWLRDVLSQISAFCDNPREQLGCLRIALTYLEKLSCQAPYLKSLQDQISADQKKASDHINDLEKLINLMDSGRNQVFAPIGFLLMWRLHFCLAIENWRLLYGPSIRGWLEAWSSFEALCALSTFAFDHPNANFPEIDASVEGLEATDLGHPLVPTDQCITNNLELKPHAPIVMVSGSNMSGKSTLLRSLGTNMILGLAGAPVCASHFRSAPFRVGASLRTQDSLQSGKSRFYAEIEQLGRVCELSQTHEHVLFLFDEILHGTNSRDRVIGAFAIVDKLHCDGAMGLVTTHDLALARPDHTPHIPLKNIHFRDELVEGRLHFDYKIYDGVVERSNALALMREFGLVKHDTASDTGASETTPAHESRKADN
jgi:hypothetical protein